MIDKSPPDGGDEHSPVDCCRWGVLVLKYIYWNWEILMDINKDLLL
jgi:hypothetical protein